MTELEATVLISLLGVGTAAQQLSILDQYGSFTNYFAEKISAIPPQLRAPLQAYRRNEKTYLADLKARLANCEQQAIGLLPISSPHYPRLLREISQPPVLLYYRGDSQVLSLPHIAIVGSRRSGRSGLELAENFAAALARSGFVIASGMALGIDAGAHRGALREGKTTAVLGTGVDLIYPRRNASLYEDILAQGGVVISEFPLGSPPLRQHFPRRNRLISGLSMGVLVVEAAVNSGSLITARLAMEQGREVFAIPGSIHNPLSRGCHRLIREGATLTECIDDMVSQLGGLIAFKFEEAFPQAEPGPQDENERKVLDAIGYELVDFDTLMGYLDLSVASLTELLINLEVQGFLDKKEGRYQRLR